MVPCRGASAAVSRGRGGVRTEDGEHVARNGHAMDLDRHDCGEAECSNGTAFYGLKEVRQFLRALTLRQLTNLLLRIHRPGPGPTEHSVHYF